MRWQGGRESENVEDRRGGGGGRPMALGGGGILVVVLLAWLFGADPIALLQQVQQNARPAQQQAAHNPEQDELVRFVKVVLADTEDVWTDLFARNDMVYRQPHLVLFTGNVESACGFASAAVGPFYCPADQKVYLDLEFYRELHDRFQAPGDFAQAYVIAHEIGHHVQNQLGISDRVQAARQRTDKVKGNELSVRLELQADFFAGVWAHHAQRTRNIIEKGDIEEALRCAAAIGDDRLQMQGRGYVVPDSFTHGTSEQRARWFRLGYETGDMSKGDTFKVDAADL
jgi:predicted metalloprotease